MASRGGFLYWQGLQALLHCICDERLILVNPGKGTTSGAANLSLLLTFPFGFKRPAQGCGRGPVGVALWLSP